MSENEIPKLVERCADRAVDLWRTVCKCSQSLVGQSKHKHLSSSTDAVTRHVNPRTHSMTCGRQLLQGMMSAFKLFDLDKNGTSPGAGDCLVSFEEMS